MYLKYLEDNLNHKFTKDMDEYKNYVKMFYNDRAKCPKDLKTTLERKQDDKILELWCKNWKVSITKPIIVICNPVIIRRILSDSKTFIKGNNNKIECNNEISIIILLTKTLLYVIFIRN